ncbi:MAG TPA: hypothetical protein VFO52_15365 [Longimicrobiales bacterium]|nr:hypothetical protein [Longimicrobiales bacterium]
MSTKRDTRTRTRTRTRTGRPARVLGADFGRLLHARWLIIALVLVHVVFAHLVMQPAPHTGGDNAGYRALAKSILERGTYQDLYDPAEAPHTQYPPVFPLVLAAASLIGLKSWLQLKYLIVGFSALGVAFTYLWIRRRGRPELAFAVALLLAVSPGVLDLSHWVLSDVPFWGMTMAAVWAWDRLRPGDYKLLVVAAVLTTLAYLTRSAGLPLLLAAAAWLGWHKRWRQLALFLLIIAPFAFWWWWRARTQGGVDYVGQFWFVNPYDPAQGRIGFGELLLRMKDNGAKYISWHLPVLLFGVQRYVPLSIIIVLLGAYGWIARMRKPCVSELFLPLYIGLLLIWPAVWSGERFLLPALPFILYYAGDGLVRLLRMAAPATARLVPAAATGMMVLLGLPQLAQATQISGECMSLYRAGDKYACLPPQWTDFAAIAELTPQLLPDSSAVLSRKPRTFYILSGVPSRTYPLTAEPDSFFRTARDAGARYVLFDRLDALSQAYLAPVLIGRSNSFCMLFSLGADRATMFGIRETPLAASPAQATSFEPCGAEFWRSGAVRDSLFGGTLQLP